MTDIGTRVGALMSADDEHVYLFGYGVYAGDEVPGEDSSGALSELARIVNKPIPKIELDNGKVVWGSECWWAPEDEVKEHLGGREVVEVDIDTERQE